MGKRVGARWGRPAGTARRPLAVAAVALGAWLGFGPVSAEAGLPYVHAHRGGTLETRGSAQVPTRTEETLKTFRHAAKAGFVLELDVKLTADDVPVVIHDAELERTTNCTGTVAEMTARQLRNQCVADLLGTAENTQPLDRNDPRREPVPTLAEVLDLAFDHGARVNLEIKNVPGDPDFESGPMPAYAKKVAAAIERSGYPPSWLIVQSFWPPNLDVIESDPYFERTPTSFLSLAASNSAAPGVAVDRGYEYVSPQWPVAPSYIQEAHALGLQVAPFTLDSAADLRDAAEAGVDAVITDDPLLAREVGNRAEPAAPKPPPAPAPADCRAALGPEQRSPVESYHPSDSGPRVFALQFLQEIRSVETYRSFRTKIECMILEYVKPRLARDRPNVVALTEDVGLMTLATGSRGEAARALASDPDAPSCEFEPVPCGIAGVIVAIQSGYDDVITEYRSRFPDMPAVGATFVAGTDTFGRGWMQTFSDMAKRYDVYILGSNNQAPFRESVDPAEVAKFADPDVPKAKTAFVATDDAAYNEVFMWAPERITDEGPRPLRNVVAQNKKVPLTEIEKVMQLEPGPATGPDAVENVRPYALPGSKARISFATSLPAFVYDGGPVTPFAEAPPAGTDPCADTSKYYMYCLDELGTNLVMQDEANPGRWATRAGGEWQPLEWMSSTWRAAADPTVSFDYNVTPHMVGNLADLPFDGQTAITQRGLGADAPPAQGCNYVGDSKFLSEDPEKYRVYSGPKTEFLGLAPWVRADASRERLRAAGEALAPSSGKPRENRYVETAVVADLPFPPDPDRPFCNGGSVAVAGPCANLKVGTTFSDSLNGLRKGDRIKALRGADAIRGRAGEDCLGGGGGDDRVEGGGHRDRIDGGHGEDLLLGDAGGDRITAAGDGSRDVVRCGAGKDTAIVDRGDRVSGCERVRRS